MIKFHKTVVAAILVLSSLPLWANNIQITKGPEIVSKDIANNKITVQIDLSWDNSWNLNRPKNHDAAWVFMKYRVDAGNFNHAYLYPTAAIVDAASDEGGVVEVAQQYGTSKLPLNGEVKNTGVFLYRKNTGSGTLSMEGVNLEWDITGTGIDANTVLSIRVFAIEMVYVPEGAYQIGDEQSFDYLVCIGDTIWNSTYTPWMGSAAATNNSPHPGSIIPKMTNNTTATGATGWKASADHEYNGSYPAYMAFDQNTSTHWHTSNGTAWHWVQIEMPVAQKATWGIFNTHSGAMGNYGIRGFYVAGSNDGVTWSPVHGDPEYIYPSTTTYKFGRNTFTNVPVAFSRPGDYRFYRFYFYAYHAVVYNIQLFDRGEDRINKISSADQLTTAYYNMTNNIAHKPADYKAIAKGWPNGFKAYYVMKHELTQSAYVDFLNCLSWDQQRHQIEHQSNLLPSAAVGTNIYQEYPVDRHRMNIRIKERGVDGPAVFGCSLNGTDWEPENNGGNIPMFNMSWGDIAAYLDWACLRPMTELEYEKACRGDQPRMREEYAWGQPYLPTRVSGVNNKNLPNEDPVPAVANYSQPEGGSVSVHTAAIAAYWPVRVGSFARSESTREEAGASYWGIMNLSDNVPERVVNISTDLGRAYTGEHGDGSITADGFSNVTNWPSQKPANFARNNQLASGTGYRGIYVTDLTITVPYPVSDRRAIDHRITGWTEQNAKDRWTGCRGVRSAE